MNDHVLDPIVIVPCPAALRALRRWLRPVRGYGSRSTTGATRPPRPV